MQQFLWAFQIDFFLQLQFEFLLVIDVHIYIKVGSLDYHALCLLTNIIIVTHFEAEEKKIMFHCSFNLFA